jgi:hypothetical protein
MTMFSLTGMNRIAINPPACLDQSVDTEHRSSSESARSLTQMISYTESITRLMGDVVSRVPQLSFIDMSRVLVFARFGRSEAEGAYATCHSLTMPSSEPGYYFWRDRRTGKMTRRSEWFITKSPSVQLGAQRIDYMISFCLPRFCDQTVERSRKESFYPARESWLAKLDTIVHELYHIDPTYTGIRRIPRADGRPSSMAHGPKFFAEVASMVQTYLDSRPDPALTDFLRFEFDELVRRFGGVTGTSFRAFPSFPQRYIEVLSEQPAEPDSRIRVVRLKQPRIRSRYTADDLHVRQFLATTSRPFHERRERAA